MSCSNKSKMLFQSFKTILSNILANLLRDWTNLCDDGLNSNILIRLFDSCTKISLTCNIYVSYFGITLRHGHDAILKCYTSQLNSEYIYS